MPLGRIIPEIFLFKRELVKLRDKYIVKKPYFRMHFIQVTLVFCHLATTSVYCSTSRNESWHMSWITSCSIAAASTEEGYGR